MHGPVRQAGSGLMSPAAEELRILATAVSAVCGRPGFVPDGYLAELAGDELGYPGADPDALAAELCRAGIWERAGGGYRSLDVEAVQVCVDRVRELQEHDAWLAGLPDPEPAEGAAGTTRFGDRVAKGPAASFRCGECGEIAGVVHVARAGSPDGNEWSSGWEPGAGNGLVLDYFLGTIWHADTGDVLDAVQELIERGKVDPVTIREISWTLWDITPFYCPECRLNYCSLDWDMHFSVNEWSHDCIIGTCPNGHRHLLG
jgi:hypothetical protein